MRVCVCVCVCLCVCMFVHKDDTLQELGISAHRAGTWLVYNKVGDSVCLSVCSPRRNPAGGISPKCLADSTVTSHARNYTAP